MSLRLDGVSDRVVVRAPAKINLFLSVHGRRDDGYHELTTVLQTVSLCDELHLRLAGPEARRHHPAGRGRMRVEVRADDPRVPDEGNLVRAAAELMGAASRAGDRAAREEGTSARVGSAGPARGGSARSDSAGRPCRTLQVVTDEDPHRDGPGAGAATSPGVAAEDDGALRTVIELAKAIPVAGGMAGGSTDAAATLLGLDALWGCDLEHPELNALAADLGSDVPFCLVGGTAIATGRGESVASVLTRGTYHWVVGIDEEPLSTPAVYRELDAMAERGAVPAEDGGSPEAVLAALRHGDPERLAAALHNDLEPAACALRPALVERRAALEEAGALAAIVSGSGPTLLGLARDADHAEALAAAVTDRFDAVHVVRSPAGGPELVA